MDAGLAAVIGAVAGAGGAILAATFAYRGALTTAREQTASARDQWRRTHRRETYIGMIGAVHDHFGLTESWYETVHRKPDQQGDPAPLDLIMEWRLSEQDRGGGPLARATIAVQLEGPPELHELACEARDKTRAYAWICLKHLAGETALDDVLVALRAHRAALDRFASAAREHLDG